ncbi:MAG TPA: guanylate kinase, partial [Clostridiales bacterium]|nr:guanylate kinase [Clostridiales bacterium]
MNNNGKMGQLVVVSGPSGSGKDTILNEIFKMDPDIIPSVSATTRPPRKGEINGVNYYFMSVEEFEERIKRDEFLEYVQYGDNYYGTLKPQLEEKLKTGKTVV